MKFNPVDIHFDILTAEVVDTCGILRLIPSVHLVDSIIINNILVSLLDSSDSKLRIVS